MNQRIKKSISSQRTDHLKIQKLAIDLGEKLVKELGLESEYDTLARWIAHYIAEQITIASRATGSKKIKTEKQCFDAILKLWEHRASLPKGCRPFERFESIFKTLERLSPENDQTYFFNQTSIDDHEKTDKTEKEVRQWLDVAKSIDEIVRIWLKYIFEQAALTASNDNTIEWLNKSINGQNDFDTSIVINLLPMDRLDTIDILPKTKKEDRIQLIENRIKQLNKFKDFNDKLIVILQKELRDTK